jgi:hypothetical protein
MEFDSHPIYYALNLLTILIIDSILSYNAITVS